MIDIIFILNKTAVPENIGASARAIKTMGFQDLYLINPQCNHLDKKAKYLAHASHDILEKAKVYTDFQTVRQEIDFLIATTANNKRSANQDFYPAKKIYSIIDEKKLSTQKIGILFGSEESGLSNQEIQSCDITTSIPLKASYPSLNLSQAVMIFAYELSSLQKNLQESNYEDADSNLYSTLKNQIIDLLKEYEVDKSHALYHRILERIALLNKTDSKLFLSVINKIIKK